MHHMIWVLYAGVLPDTCHSKDRRGGGGRGEGGGPSCDLV